MLISFRLELALHTMCLALEENSFSGELWSHYLHLLHARRGGQSHEDLDEMVSQAIELVPVSTQIWDLVRELKMSNVDVELVQSRTAAGNFSS